MQDCLSLPHGGSHLPTCKYVHLCWESWRLSSAIYEYALWLSKDLFSLLLQYDGWPDLDCQVNQLGYSQAVSALQVLQWFCKDMDKPD